MKNITTLLLALLILASCQKSAKQPELLRRFNIQSTINGGNYDIKVSLPHGYDPEHKNYAAIYVLDGEDNLNFVAAETKRLSNKYSKEDVLVVSIGYGHDRAEDYTPTKAEGQGGAPKFIQFIEQEFVPLIEKKLAADTTRKGRIILGHSYGGLFGAYAMTTHNHLFGSYLLLSPSLWYDDEIILQYEKENREHLKDQPQTVFLGLGELENAGRMLAPFEAFYQIIRNNYTKTNLTRNVVPNLAHTGSKNTNISKALEFYFQNK